jgi:hypothetical protein
VSPVVELILGAWSALGQLGHALLVAPLGFLFGAVLLYVGYREATR